ncbi:MAG: hypothetical protein QXV64_01015 [Candidatus Anstonellaceae archaeon]
MLLEGDKEKKLEKGEKESDKISLTPGLLSFIKHVGLSPQEAQRILQTNSQRIENLVEELEKNKGKNIKNNKRELGFVNKEVPKEKIEEYVKIVVLAESVFGIEAEYLLAIATQESNLKNPKNGDGFYQINQLTIKELKNKKRFDQIKNRICEDRKDNPHLKEILENIYSKIISGFEPSANFGTQTILAILVLYLKHLEKNIPISDKKNLAKEYNGSKRKDEYAEEVMERYLYLKKISFTEKRKKR